MNAEQNPEYSLFARTLKDLMDETGLFRRPEWATLLGADEKDLDQWITDKTIPRADELFVLVDTLRWSDLKSEEPLERYDQIAFLQATEISPMGRFMLPSVAEWIMKPTTGFFGFPYEIEEI